MNLAWTLTACIGIFGIIVLVGLVVAGRPRNVSARLKELTSTNGANVPPSRSPPGRREDAIPLLTRLLTGRRMTERLYVELSAAGLPIRPSEFVGILGGSVILSQMFAWAAAHTIVGHLVLGIIGIILPIMVVRSLQKKRRAAFDGQIVDALVTMSASFRRRLARCLSSSLKPRVVSTMPMSSRYRSMHSHRIVG